MITIRAAEHQNTVRQPKLAAMNKDSGRASMMPVSSPAMTLPTTRPRRSAGTRWASRGISTWAPVEHSPMTKAATKKDMAAFAVAIPTRPSVVIAISVRTRRRFSTRSASETSRNRPQP